MKFYIIKTQNTLSLHDQPCWFANCKCKRSIISHTFFTDIKIFRKTNRTANIHIVNICNKNVQQTVFAKWLFRFFNNNLEHTFERIVFQIYKKNILLLWPSVIGFISNKKSKKITNVANVIAFVKPIRQKTYFEFIWNKCLISLWNKTPKVINFPKQI